MSASIQQANDCNYCALVVNHNAGVWQGGPSDVLNAMVGCDVVFTCEVTVATDTVRWRILGTPDELNCTRSKFSHLNCITNSSGTEHNLIFRSIKPSLNGTAINCIVRHSNDASIDTNGQGATVILQLLPSMSLHGRGTNQQSYMQLCITITVAFPFIPCPVDAGSGDHSSNETTDTTPCQYIEPPCEHSLILLFTL